MNIAVISPCGKYRYALTRSIEQPIRWVKPVLFIMLNPSTADAVSDDPTIRRCIQFTKDMGGTKLTVCNLFALRSTDPEQLLKAEDPIGPDNLMVLMSELKDHTFGEIILAFGNHKAVKKFDLSIFDHFNVKCLGTTKNGMPRHPLYLKKDTKPVEWKRK